MPHAHTSSTATSTHQPPEDAPFYGLPRRSCRPYLSAKPTRFFPLHSRSLPEPSSARANANAAPLPACARTMAACLRSSCAAAALALQSNLVLAAKRAGSAGLAQPRAARHGCRPPPSSPRSSPVRPSSTPTDPLTSFSVAHWCSSARPPPPSHAGASPPPSLILAGVPSSGHLCSRRNYPEVALGPFYLIHPGSSFQGPVCKVLFLFLVLKTVNF